MAQAISVCFCLRIYADRARLGLQSPSTKDVQRRQRSRRATIQGRRVGEWHRKHRSLSGGETEDTSGYGRDAACCVDLPVRGDGRRGALLPGRPPSARPAAGEDVMATQVLERRFGAIGARVKVVRGAGPVRIDVGSERRGEFFELRLARGPEGASSSAASTSDTGS